MKILLRCVVAVIVALLMLSCVTALNVVKSYRAQDSLSTKTNNENRNVSVDSQIHLIKKDLPLLKKSLRYIRDSNYRTVLLKIISVIESKGEADSQDIKNIIMNSDVEITEILTGRMKGEAFGFGLGLPFFYGKSYGGIVFWATEPPDDYGDDWFGSIIMGEKEYTHGYYTCLAIGYFGYFWTFMKDWDVIPRVAFHQDGVALLILFKKTIF